jgi:hypothetical protein
MSGQEQEGQKPGLSGAFTQMGTQQAQLRQSGTPAVTAEALAEVSAPAEELVMRDGPFSTGGARPRLNGLIYNAPGSVQRLPDGDVIIGNQLLGIRDIPGRPGFQAIYIISNAVSIVPAALEKQQRYHDMLLRMALGHE